MKRERDWKKKVSGAVTQLFVISERKAYVRKSSIFLVAAIFLMIVFGKMNISTCVERLVVVDVMNFYVSYLVVFAVYSAAGSHIGCDL